MPAADDPKRKAARETLDILDEISILLNTQLDLKSLSFCVSLIESGVSPEALATVIKDLRVQKKRQEGAKNDAVA
nr:mitotic-spindle organizing protein 1 [Quercus suber]